MTPAQPDVAAIRARLDARYHIVPEVVATIQLTGGERATLAMADVATLLATLLAAQAEVEKAKDMVEDLLRATDVWQSRCAAAESALGREREWARWLVYVVDDASAGSAPVAGFTYADAAQRWAESSYRGRYRLVQRKSDDMATSTPGGGSGPA